MAKPPLCQNGCGNPVPFARVKQGAKYCGSMCSINALSKINLGRAKHPPRLPSTAVWNGKVKQLAVPRNVIFSW